MSHLCLALFGGFSRSSLVFIHHILEHILVSAFVYTFLDVFYMRENFSLAKQRCFFILLLSL